MDVPTVEWIRAKAAVGDYELTQHAEIERQADRVGMHDLDVALRGCELVESYPQDPRGASCLVLGFGDDGRPLHIVCGRAGPEVLRVITVYVPTMPKWLDARTRRQR